LSGWQRVTGFAVDGAYNNRLDKALGRQWRLRDLAADLVTMRHVARHSTYYFIHSR
jgi:hypothetical protein